jgi:hypothetical protein
MDIKQFLWPAIGAGMIYAADKVKAVPAVARVPLAAIGAILIAKAIPVINDRI